MTTLVSSTDKSSGQRLHGDAVVVGRRQRERLAGEARQDAGEDRPCLVGRGGERHLREGTAQEPSG